MSTSPATSPGKTRSPRIVGIGASAGGLEAIEQFIGKVPHNSNIAYIVVQHLDPSQPTLLPELLQRLTPMPVRAAVHGLRVEANNLYVIPPNADLRVVANTLQLSTPLEPRGRRLPVDVLFASLARAQGTHAIGVILSGMGSDGTRGAQAIKAAGGVILAQEPASARFDSMPQSAIAAGYADIVVSAAEMPSRIQAIITGTNAGETVPGEDPDATLQQIIRTLHRRTRHDFSLYKPRTLLRRIERRMAVHGNASLAEYASLLERGVQEPDLLFKELLIGVTNFFRDPDAWEYFGETVLPELLARHADRPVLRAWCVGCSTGEEAYSLAMAFIEAAGNQPSPHPAKLQVFASDLSEDAIAVARRGVYPQTIRNSVTPERLTRFFTAQGTQYRINNNIREMVMFARHDVVRDPPFTRLDLLLCRNLLIYFDQTLQRRLLPLFHYSLRSGGVMMLGTSETIGRFHHLFTPLQAKLRLYQRLDTTPAAGTLPIQSFPPLSGITKEQSVPSTQGPSNIPVNLETAADRLLLQVHAPAAVVLNDGGDIVYISGRTGKYLEPAAGKANWNFHAMVREELRGQLATAIKKAAGQDDAVLLHGLQVARADGVQVCDVAIQHLREPAALQGMTMITFRDVATTASDRGKQRGKTPPEAVHASELQQYRDEIQTLREEARASREELQAFNEALQSANEELQSANEELTTSKEEMQSMNEELQTINNELHTKLDDLALAQSDLQNTLNNIEIAILFLDQNLNVRRYTDRVAHIINLRESDVGRPLSDLTTTLQYPTMGADARETARTLVFSEKQIPTGDGRWFAVRIMPYRRLDNMIDGLVITLVDITATKELESSLRKHSTLS